MQKVPINENFVNRQQPNQNNSQPLQNNSEASGRSPLRSLIKQRNAKSPSPEQSPGLERDISECTDAISFILARAHCPTQYRAYVDAVIGAANGRLDWFEASDLEIGKRMMGSGGDGKSADSIQKRVQRDRQTFAEWQKLEGYRLIECEPGGKKDEKYFKSRYRVHLLAAAAAALEAARSNSAWQRTPAKALSRAAEIALMSLEGRLIRRERFNRPRQDGETMLNRYRKTILTHAGKISEIIERNGGDPTEFLEKLTHDILAMSTPEFIEDQAQLVHVKEQHDSGQNSGTWGGASPMDKSVPPPHHPDENKAPERNGDLEVGQVELSGGAEQIAFDPEPSEGGVVAEAVEMIDAMAAFCDCSFELTLTDELTP